MIEVEDGTGLGLFTVAKSLLSMHEIPLSNIIGFAADNCATMMEPTSGFTFIYIFIFPLIKILLGSSMIILSS